MKYSYIVTSKYVSVMNLETGVVTKIGNDNARYADAVNAAKAGKFDEIEQMTIKNVINASAKIDGNQVVSVRDGRVFYTQSNGAEIELNNEMTKRIVNNIRDGYDAKPFINFMTNLMANPSATAIDELYLFLEETELPITSDGCFIAYKIVKNDYTSIYDGKFANNVGDIVEMPRNMVDDNRNATCSFGLHFCSKEYLQFYGSGSRNDDRLLLLKINPADVVSIPSDYNNAKGRASKYLIWKDISEPGWREKYYVNDYNDSSVEDYFEEEELDDELEDELEDVCPDCGHDNYTKKGSVLSGGVWKYRRKCNICGKNYYVDMGV